MSTLKRIKQKKKKKKTMVTSQQTYYSMRQRTSNDNFEYFIYEKEKEANSKGDMYKEFFVSRDSAQRAGL